jgi:hypothetical protein
MVTTREWFRLKGLLQGSDLMQVNERATRTGERGVDMITYDQILCRVKQTVTLDCKGVAGFLPPSARHTGSRGTARIIDSGILPFSGDLPFCKTTH